MIITESRLRTIIRHVLGEAGLGTYKRKKRGALEQMRTPVHQTMGYVQSHNDDDGYDSVMGFDESDDVEEGELEESDPVKPSGCS